MTEQNEEKTPQEPYEFLSKRFLMKDSRYFDTSRDELSKFSRADLIRVLRDLGYSDDDCTRVDNMIKRRGLRTWSGQQVFRPNEGRILAIGDGMYDVNAWKAVEVRPSANDDDTEPFETFLKRLVPNDAEREWLIDFLAHRYQRPHVKPAHGAILYGPQGTGKSTLGDIVGAVYGNTKRVNTAEGLVGRFSASNWLGLWVVAEEIPVSKGGISYNALKDLITAEKRMGEKKGVDFAVYQTSAALLLCSNTVPSFIEEDDRRFFIVEVPAKESRESIESYFQGFRDWLDNRDGYSKIAGFLSRRDISGYSPMAAPLVTESKKQLIGLVKTGLEQQVCDWFDDLGANVVSEEDFHRAFEPKKPEELRYAVKKAGWLKFDGPDKGRISINGTKKHLLYRSGTKIVPHKGKSAEFEDLDGTRAPLADVLKRVKYADEEAL